MSAGAKKKCPTWLVYACSSYAALEFLSTEVSLNFVVEKYTDGFKKTYAPIPNEVFYSFANEYLQFLSQADEADAVAVLRDYTFFLINFSSITTPRKRKGLMGGYSWLDPADLAIYDTEDAKKHFQSYIVTRRSGKLKKAPVGWKPSDEDGFDPVATIMEKEIDPLAYLTAE